MGNRNGGNNELFAKGVKKVTRKNKSWPDVKPICMCIHITIEIELGALL